MRLTRLNQLGSVQQRNPNYGTQECNIPLAAVVACRWQPPRYGVDSLGDMSCVALMSTLSLDDA